MYIQKIKVYVEIRRNNIMVKKIRMKVVFAAFAGVMFFGGVAFSPNKSQAAKKVSITKSVKVYEGKTAKIKLSNNKKKVTWSVTKGSGNIGLSKKSKTGVTVKGSKAGTAKVQAKVGSKKYVCTVTVKKAAPDADAKKGILTKNNLSYWGVKNSGNIVIPEGVKKIGDGVFDLDVDSGQISGVKLPNTLEVIGKNAFALTKITNIKLPDSLKTIGDYAFSMTNIENLEIPENVSEIGNGAFMGNAKLKSVKLPGSLESIGVGLFMGCDKLSDVTFSEGLSVIPAGSFNMCTSLKSIDIPDSVTVVSSECFLQSGITEVKLPDGLKEISDNSFNADTKVTWKNTAYNDYSTFFAVFKG